MTCSLSSKEFTEKYCEFRAACSVYIRFRGVNGYRLDRADPRDSPLPGDQAGLAHRPVCTRTYNRILRPGLAQILPIEVLDDSKLRQGFDQIDQVIDRWIEKRNNDRERS